MTEPRTEATAAGDSRAAILAAAAEEFAERGLDGVRMEHVARRAGYNKALVYRHFGSREQLFQAVLEAALAERRAVLQRQPRALGETLSTWSAATFARPVFGKLLMREALEFRGDERPEAEARKAYYAEQVRGVAAAQARGMLPSGLQPEFLFLALLAVVTLPALLPQVAELATGADPATEDFQAGWTTFLRDFANALGRAGAPADEA